MDFFFFFPENYFQLFLYSMGPIWKGCHEQSLTVGQME